MLLIKVEEVTSEGQIASLLKRARKHRQVDGPSRIVYFLSIQLRNLNAEKKIVFFDQ
jgi:hypothetical protein